MRTQIINPNDYNSRLDLFYCFDLDEDIFSNMHGPLDNAVKLRKETIILDDKEIVVEPMEFLYVENAYQAYKTLDLKTRMILAEVDPYEAKKISKSKDFEIRDDLTDIKRIKIMYYLVKQKFKKNKELLKVLISNPEAIIAEGNKYNDSFWGLVFKTFSGNNYLGRIIMIIRDEILFKDKPNFNKIMKHRNGSELSYLWQN